MAAKDLPPAPDGLPLLGNTHQLLQRNLLTWMTDLTQTHDGIVRLEVAGKTIVLVSNPSDIERVLIDENDQFQKGGFQKHVTASLLGDGLVLADGDQWRTHRHALEPAFHPRHMARFAECIQKQTRRQIADWSDGDVIDLGSEMQELTLAIIADALFDVDVRTESWDLSSAFTRILEHFERIGQTYIYVPEWIPTPANREYRRAVAELNDVVDEIIASHARGERSGDSVVALLLDQVADSEEWDREAIRDEIVTLLVAGHETTALALTFTVYLLGTHPGVTNDTRAAVDGLNDASFLRGVQDCQMMDRVLKESLRLYPPAYSIFREPMSDIELGGYRIPAGSIVALSQWATHRNEKIFESPEEFRPSRWTAEFESALSPGAYFPFAAGPRRCIGERFAKTELKIVLAMVLQQYEFEVVSDVPLEVVPSLSTRPKHPVRVKIRERTPQ